MIEAEDLTRANAFERLGRMRSRVVELFMHINSPGTHRRVMRALRSAERAYTWATEAVRPGVIDARWQACQDQLDALERIVGEAEGLAGLEGEAHGRE
jgi:hypothetical protein